MFVNEPQVQLVARQVFDVAGVVGFLNAHALEWEELRRKIDSDLDLGDRDPEYVCELASRLRTMSFDGAGGTHADRIQRLFEAGHGSVLEHTTWCFVVWHVSRGLTHELVRHRIGVSYSQLSQGHVDASDTTFVVPPAIQELAKTNPPVFERWKAHMAASRALYADLTGALGELHPDIPDQTQHRQAARSVLPNATGTGILLGANTRALRHMIETRAHPASDPEIRRLFVKVFEIMQRVSPLLMHGMRAVTLDDGSRGVESAYRKV